MSDVLTVYRRKGNLRTPYADVPGWGQLRVTPKRQACRGDRLEHAWHARVVTLDGRVIGHVENTERHGIAGYNVRGYDDWHPTPWAAMCRVFRLHVEAVTGSAPELYHVWATAGGSREEATA